ncbi:hypothetical protein [Kineococcus sp. R86509]|uniref:hypothetical protein n=1 Tax=Kineococcus sp. R86509 TaxID=3093851 RepID=UPI0036D210BA
MDPLQRARARTVLGYLPPEHMSTWANTALSRGYDSPAVRELATASPEHDPAELRLLLATALEQLHAPHLTDEQARWVMVHTYAHAILEGLLPPQEGAELIAEESAELALPDELAPMCEAADPWQRGWSTDEELDQWIRDRATQLLAGMDRAAPVKGAESGT